MSNRVKFLLLLLLPVTLAGCLTAGLGPKFSQPLKPETGKAVIYVYRQRVAMTGHEMPGVKMNDQLLVSSLPEINYFPVSVEPGTYTFGPKLFGIYKTTTASVNAQPGQVYHVRLKVKFGHLELEHVNKDEAMAYMATCYLINPGYVEDSRVLVGGKAAAPKTRSVATSPPQPVSAKTEPPAPKPAPALDTPSHLFVKTSPAGARIRIMNIKPAFEQGIELAAGKYDLEITASGYQKYRQWIEVKEAEEKQIQVVLPPLTAPTQENAVVVKQPVAKQPTLSKISDRGASAEEKRYGTMLLSDSARSIRDAAKNIYYRYADSKYLASVAEQSLLQNYTSPLGDLNMHVDAMAWLCKALAQTHDSRFATTLSTVAENAPYSKLRKYAKKSLSQL